MDAPLKSIYLFVKNAVAFFESKKGETVKKKAPTSSAQKSSLYKKISNKRVATHKHSKSKFNQPITSFNEEKTKFSKNKKYVIGAGRPSHPGLNRVASKSTYATDQRRFHKNVENKAAITANSRIPKVGTKKKSEPQVIKEEPKSPLVESTNNIVKRINTKIAHQQETFSFSKEETIQSPPKVIEREIDISMTVNRNEEQEKRVPDLDFSCMNRAMTEAQ